MVPGHGLSVFPSTLSGFPQHRSGGTGGAEIPAPHALTGKGAAAHWFRNLESQSGSVTELLLRKVNAQLAHLLAAASTSVSTAGSRSAGNAEPADDETRNSGGPEAAAANTYKRCFAHCLRALAVVGRGSCAEEQFRESVVEPLVRCVRYYFQSNSFCLC